MIWVLKSLKRNFKKYNPITAQYMNSSIKDFFSKCDQKETADFVTFTEEILNGRVHFMCSEFYSSKYNYVLKQALISVCFA